MSLPKPVSPRASTCFQKPDHLPTKTHNGACPQDMCVLVVAFSNHPCAAASQALLNYLFRPWLLPWLRAGFWDWKLAGWAAWYHGQSWGDGGGLGLGTLILSMCSLAMKA